MRAGRPQLLSGWGRIPSPGREVRSEDLAAITRDAVLCRGLGRSYGDSSLPAASSPVEGSATLTDAQAADLMAGKYYVNIHTAANPGGEIRGQVTK